MNVGSWTAQGRDARSDEPVAAPDARLETEPSDVLDIGSQSLIALRARRKERKLSDPAVWFGVGSVIAFTIGLEIIVRAGIVSPLLIALPSEALSRLFEPEFLAEVVDATRTSASLIAAAMVCEILVALPLGYFLFTKRRFGLAYEGWLASISAAPIFLLYPLFMVIFGRTPLTLIIMGVLTGLAPMVIHVRLAFMSVPQTLIKTGKSFGLSEFAIFRMIMMPSGAPTIFTGLRIGLVYTMINVIAIEYLANIGGLGRLVSDRYFRFDIVGMYTGIFAVMAISLGFYVLFTRLETLVKR